MNDQENETVNGNNLGFAVSAYALVHERQIDVLFQRTPSTVATSFYGTNI